MATLFIVGVIPATGIAQNATAVPSEADVDVSTDIAVGPFGAGYQRRLSDIGYEQGIELARLSDVATVFFPLPVDVDITQATLTVAYDSFLPGYLTADLQIRVNGAASVVEIIETAPQSNIVEIPLTEADLAEPFLEVSFVHRGAFTDNRCFDDRAAPGFVRILPDSRVDLTIDPDSFQSIRGAWSAMPQSVVVGIAGGGDGAAPASFQAAWSIGHFLHRENYEVEFQTVESSSDMADVDIFVDRPRTAGGEETAFPGTFLRFGDADVPAASMSPSMVGETGSARLLRRDDRSASGVSGGEMIVISDPQAWLGADLLGSSFRPLAGGAVSVVHRLDRRDLMGRNFDVLLTDIDSVQLQQEIVERGEWGVDFAINDLPPFHLPDRLRLGVASVPPLGARPNTASLYVNNSLIWSQRLSDEGGPQHFTIDLPSHLTAMTNSFRLLVQREPVSTACEGPVASYPAELLSDSTVRMAPTSGTPRDFPGLAARLGSGTQVFLPNNVLRMPAESLHLLTRLGAQFLRSPLPRDITFYNGSLNTRPTSPFLLIGQPSDATIAAPVSFDRGRIILEDDDGIPYLDLANSHALAVVQVASSGDVPGLWINAVDGRFPLPAEVSIQRGNVAFIDQTGVALSLQTDRDSALSVDYPEEIAWYDSLQVYRAQAVLFVWLLITVVAILLLRRLYRARLASYSENRRAENQRAENDSGSPDSQ